MKHQPGVLFSLLILLSSTVGLSSCTSTSSAQDERDLGDAILSPAEDLNLKRTEIPQILKDLDDIYAVKPDTTCEEISAEIAALTEVLGVDEHAVEHQKKSTSQKTSEATLDAVSGVTSGVIPFRGLVKWASGATAHEKRIRNAYVSGLKRRSFLIGLASGGSCSE